jgi:DNA-binding transcriptional MerR regulator
MAVSSPTRLKIGKVAAQSGLPIKTIRYDESLGLLTVADRTEGKFRLFRPEVITR